LIFGQFEAELQETVKPTNEEPRFQLVGTGRKVKVDFKHRNDDMVVGENLTIVPKQDGGWTLVWWECND
jgi:hypothetical protein